VNYRPPGGDAAGRGRPVPPRSGQRGPRPPANAGRVVGGRDGGYPRERRTADARWEPNPPPPSRRPRREPEPIADRPNGLLRGGKAILVIISVAVLVVTGYYWRELDKFDEGMTTADVISEPQEKPADGAVDILMVGMDSRTDAQGNPLSEEQLAMLRTGEEGGVLNTDTLILMRIPNDGGKAYGVSLPRDSYVDIPNGYGQHKINSAYLRAKNDSLKQLQGAGLSEADKQVQSNQEGAKNIIATVEQLTGAKIDHYAEVNLLGFYDITNAIGGIDVCLKQPVDEYRSGANFPAGPQTIAGADALAFVRQRHDLPNGDLDRIVRQQVFMNGMAKKVMSQDMLTPGSDTLDNLRKAIQKSVVLDKDWNVLQFAQQMMKFTGGNLEFKTIPVGRIDLETEEDGEAVEVDPDEVKQFVSGLLGGKPPADDSSSSNDGEQSSEEAGSSDVVVNVFNASSVDGLARNVSEFLGGKGFQPGVVDTAEARDETVVRYASGEEDKGKAVAEALGGNITVEEDANLTAGSVTVLLGADFDDSVVSGLTGNQPLQLSPHVHQQPQPPGPDANGCVN
jgi:LCP family protein required for cell wall assembly